MRLMTTLSRATVLLTLAIATGQYAFAQQDGGSATSTAIGRNGGLNLPRNGATIDPELAQKHYRRGNTYSNLERLDEALEEYQLAITADPNFDDTYRNLANIYYFQERYDEAIPMLDRYISLQTEPSVGLIASLNTLGELLRKAGRLDEAIIIDLQAIENDPQNVSQVFVMGNTYFNARRVDDAISIYKKALEVKPNEAFFHRTLGRMYEDEERLEEALLEYRAAADLDRGSQFYKDLVSSTEARLGK